MTATSTHGTRWSRRTVLAAGLLALPLAAGCADDASPAEDSSAGGGSAPSAPTVDASCPSGLTAGDLTDRVDYGRADVDGDGEADAISIGTVPDGGAGCRAALVVTTAAGTAATALPGLQVVPPRSFVPGGAASIGAESVIAAPVSFSPRGGGEIGLFTLVDGVLTPVQDDSGERWTILATIDDGGGSPQTIDCAGEGLRHTLVVSDPLSGAIKIRLTRYSLEGAELSRTGASTATMYPRDTPDGTEPPRRGLSIFASC
jgi:hypothetical protein